MSNDLIESLRDIVGDTGLKTAGDDTASFLTDWHGQYQGQALAVVMPETTEQVSQVMGFADAHDIVVVPQGGNTGFMGGATPDSSGHSIVLSLRRMNRIREIDPTNMSMTVEAGCVLQTLHEATEAEGLYFPLNLAAKGSCTIGGNLGTNAGGLNVVRYGSARALCLGLEVVTAAGEVMDLLPALKKNNTGYDLVNLMVGSEGTLGIITAASLKLVTPPHAFATAMVKVRDVEAALQLMNMTQSRSGGQVEAFELIGKLMYELSVKYLDHVSPVFDEAPDLAVLMELGAARPEDAAPGPDGTVALSALLESILGDAFEAGLVEDAVIAQSDTQRANFWAMREGTLDAMQRHGPWVMNDISFQVSDLPGVIADMEAAFAAVAPGPFCVAFGHMGDGNLHINARPYDADPKDHPQEAQAIKDAVRDIVVKWRGSISAEHGIGLDKQHDMKQLKDPVAYAMMKSIKQALDPDNLLNPGKVLL